MTQVGATVQLAEFLAKTNYHDLPNVVIEKTKELIIDCTNGFLDGFFESPANTHDLTRAFHAAAQESADVTKLFERGILTT